jgi:hypothetical protein
VAVLAAHDELAIIGEDINCRLDPCSEKAVAAIVNRLAFVVTDVLPLVFGFLNSAVT